VEFILLCGLVGNRKNGKVMSGKHYKWRPVITGQRDEPDSTVAGGDIDHGRMCAAKAPLSPVGSTDKQEIAATLGIPSVVLEVFTSKSEQEM